MSVTIEFFGIPRQRAETSVTQVEALRLGEALLQLASRFPALAECCFDGTKLRPGYIANLNGSRFVSDPETPLQPEDCLLILSADAGG